MTNQVKPVTKSLRFSGEESDLIEQISRREHLSESALLRKIVLDGLSRYRLDRAIEDYQDGIVNLAQAAQLGGVTTDRLMLELDRRGIDLGSEYHVVNSLKNLADMFGASSELTATIGELESRQAS